jgi:outer membrane biosynthesis protein TonB
MLEAYRARTVPNAATKAAMLQRLRRHDPGRLVISVALSVAIAAAILLAIAAVGRVMAPAEVVPPGEQAVYGAAPPKREQAETRAPAVAPAPRVEAKIETPPPPAPAPPKIRRAPARIEAPQPEPAPPSITEEARLLARAQQALRADAPDRALELLDEHGRRFPSGAMALEREALRAIASCKAHRPDAAARARTLLSRPDAASYAARIRSACEP